MKMYYEKGLADYEIGWGASCRQGDRNKGNKESA